VVCHVRHRLGVVFSAIGASECEVSRGVQPVKVAFFSGTSKLMVFYSAFLGIDFSNNAGCFDPACPDFFSQSG
jgi:hypothetical protein